MKKLLSLTFGLSLLLVACSEGSESASGNEESNMPSACDCAKANQSGDSALMETCKNLRSDAQFDEEYRRCVAAQITGKDPSKVNLVNPDKMKLSFPEDGTYTISPEDSKLSWTGNGLTQKHTGTIQIKEGVISIINEEITSGEVIVDMTTITNNDLEGDEAVKLEAHLRSDDFFGVDEFPLASFSLKQAKFINNKAVVEGDLTIKGKTHPATINLMFSGDGNQGMTLTGAFLFDRSLYDVRYGSESFFDNLGDDLIKDHIMMKFDIKATK